MTTGISEDPITNGMFVFFTSSAGGACNQTALDAIAPISPANTILNYIPGSIGAALRYENELTGARLVYLSFGFEGIAGPQANSPSNLIAKILAWLGGITSVEEEVKDSSVPKGYSLCQNYPNPFNSTITIKYSIPQDGFVTLKIYNSFSFTFNTTNVTSSSWALPLRHCSATSIKESIIFSGFWCPTFSNVSLIL